MRIGVFCSGGDAPGMNPCVRAIVRTAFANGHEVVGIRRGYQGLLDEDFYKSADGITMSVRSVSGWSRFGGTFLRTSRSEEFKTDSGLRKASDVLRRHKIDALLAIGGDGTFRGAHALREHWEGGIVGCPGTIDNDLIGTDMTIGFATAVRTAVEAVDKIRDTAESHERMFLIEVMGRHNGSIALFTAIACGAETVCVPETPTDIPGIVAKLQLLKERGKTSVMMIIAEGDEKGGAVILNEQLKEANCPFSTRVVVLGHLQRGGAPSPEDRVLASELGMWAVEALQAGHTHVMVGNVGGERRLTPFEKTFGTQKPLPDHLLRLVETLAH